jgi:hypothetical protein
MSVPKFVQAFDGGIIQPTIKCLDYVARYRVGRLASIFGLAAQPVELLMEAFGRGPGERPVNRFP